MSDTQKVHIISLGCARNLVDSENMAGLLQGDKGYKLSDHANEADIIIVNTCGFIDEAKQESIDTILGAAENKKNGNCKKLVVTGCLSERYPQELKDSLPEVDLITGTAAFPRIVEELESLKNSTSSEPKVKIHTDRAKDYDLPRANSLSSHSAYLKLAEGCAKRCSFCIIPKLRGNLRSRSIESLVTEAQTLIQNGVREINLIAQDLTDYGRDRKDGATLAELLKKLVQIEDLKWLRLFYVYPDQLSDDVIQLVRDEEKICKYLDVPIQHISDKILTRMNRHTNKEQIRSMIARLKKEIPNLFIRTSLMVGFPGETQEDFLELKNFVKEGLLDHVGVFTYSHEEGTPSFRLPDDVPAEVKKQRQAEIYALQEEILNKNLRSLVGQTLEVLVEGQHPETELLLRGRFFGQAPQVDNMVIIQEGHADIGSFMKVEIRDIAGMDLVGGIVS
ncbi:MAG: 30S ribosomal protein S12 methylthiotransferase RimO [bacterium]